MQADLETIKQNLDNGDEVLANIRCSFESLIYRNTMRPGILAATQNKLIFCADSLVRNELIEIYQYKDISNISLKKGLINKYISINHKGDIVRFSHLTSDNVEDFVNTIKSKIRQ